MDRQKLIYSNRKLVLEDGSEYYGVGFGYECNKVCEIVFNTSMVGYQEIISDPSYTYQAVVMTYPLIGNYGIADDDYETKVPSIGALIVREYNDQPSNFRYTKTLSEVMEDYKIPGIAGLDTRKLTRSIRDGGSRKVLITAADTPLDKALEILRTTDLPKNVVEKVSCKKRWYSRTANAKYNVVAIDCGIKHNIIRMLNSRGCNVTVVPYSTSFDEIVKMNPDGIVISNGPGNPEDAQPVIELVKQLKGKYPMFGIGLGHQIINLAYGAKTYKLKFGVCGDQPIKNVDTGKIETTSQNHIYAVDSASIASTALEATHLNVLDGEIEGTRCKADKVFSVQYQPESAPGPEDSVYLFDLFIDLMKGE